MELMPTLPAESNITGEDINILLPSNIFHYFLDTVLNQAHVSFERNLNSFSINSQIHV